MYEQNFRPISNISFSAEIEEKAVGNRHCDSY